MIKSIQHFEETGIKNLEEAVESFAKNPTNMARFVYGVTDSVVSLGLDIIRETLEDFDQMLRESGKRKLKWEIVRRDTKELTTSLGGVTFPKTLFRNKETGENAYLLDRVLGIDPHERLTEDAEARILSEAADASYRKAGEEASLLDEVSKQTVKNKVHGLTFPKDAPAAQKKTVDYLYIDADEDHVSLQFKEKKGDLEKDENGRKNNCVMVKLVYVYEGIEPEAPKSKRHRLVNAHYFSGVYDGDDNAKLWDEVYEYMDSHYDLNKVKKIYLNADGGAWIQAGKRRIAGITSVLDEFHLRKYLLKMTSHTEDSAEDARKELCEAIRNGTKADFENVVERLDGCTESESTKKRIADGAGYILSNWAAARARLGKTEGTMGCSAEGHVSHVLSSRMSLRPMGWSRHGADMMGHLRAYYWNGGDMLQLVRSQPRAGDAATDAAGQTEKPLSCSDILQWERQHYNELGKYVDSISHSVSLQAKMKLGFREHIYGL